MADTATIASLATAGGDQDGGHDTVTQYSLTPDENGDWLLGITRHWSVN